MLCTKRGRKPSLLSFTIAALNCQRLEAPMNGSIDCNTQTVGGTCSFSCDPSHTLRGASSRSCLTFLEWSGQPAECDPPMCPRLSPPANGFVEFPCFREEGCSCGVMCAHGYVINGHSEQTCTSAAAAALDWTVAPMCEGML